MIVTDGHPQNFSYTTSFLKNIIKIQSCLTNAEFNLNAFMQLVAEEMQKLTPATGAVVELVEGDELVYRAATGTVEAYLGLRLPIETSISGLCVRSNCVLRSDDTETDNRVNAEACRKVAARSLVVTPLVHKGNTVGVLKILSNKPQAFSETDVQTLQLMAGYIASGLSHQLSYETIEKLLDERNKMLKQLEATKNSLYHVAHYDYLTDLANRKTFYENLNNTLAKAQRNGSLIGLMYIDIDHFKTINDKFGHDTGDALLKAFSARLKPCIRSYDFVARLGGDEFIILLDNVNAQENAVRIAEKILAKMREKFKIKTLIFNITISVGLSFYQGGNTSAEDFIKQADVALYSAKNAGRNTFKMYVDGN